ncbi:hypothetical protein Tco_0411244 [Tanacetum coccineum]
MFARCLTTRSTVHDQPLLQIMQMLYCFVNNVHVDYVELLWEGLHYSLKHPSTLILYLRFTNLIMGHYMTAYPKISKRARDKNTIQLSIAEEKSRDDLEAQQNVEKVKKHLVAREIEKMVEGTKSEDADEVDNSILNSQNDSGTRVKEKNVEESRNTPSLKPIIIFGIEKLQELTITDPTPSSSTPSSSSSKLTASHASYLYSNLRLDISNNTRVSLMR